MNQETSNLHRDDHLYRVGDAHYIHLQPRKQGFGYTLYSAHSGRQLGQGHISAGDPLEAAAIAAKCHALPENTFLRMQENAAETAGRGQLAAVIEKDLLSGFDDVFAIYKLKQDPALDELRFKSFDDIDEEARPIVRENYSLLYAGKLPDPSSLRAYEHLEALRQQFTQEPPADFGDERLAVSDVMLVRHGGVVSCVYLDQNIFYSIEGFFTKYAPLCTPEFEALAHEVDELLLDAWTFSYMEYYPERDETQAEITLVLAMQDMEALKESVSEIAEDEESEYAGHAQDLLDHISLIESNRIQDHAAEPVSYIVSDHQPSIQEMLKQPTHHADRARPPAPKRHGPEL